MELARNLKIECVSRLQPTAALCLTSQQSVAEAVALMHQREVGCVLICDRERLVGIFTERDLLRRVLAPGRSLSIPLALCMTADPVVVHPTETIGAAVRRMEEGGYRHLPVVDAAAQPLGILSVKRIVHYLVEHFPSTIYNLPPDPGVFPQKPEGA